RAPVLPLTELSQLLSNSAVKKPPGHRPSFWLSRFRVTLARPPYSHSPDLPPSTTPWPICVRLRSSLTPFSTPCSRIPPQSWASVGRVSRSPNSESDDSAACATIGAPPSRKLTARTPTFRSDIVPHLFIEKPPP